MTTGASAASVTNVSFFSGADGSAHWAPNHSAIVLSETTTAGAYAGVQFMHIGPNPPGTAPNFTQQDSVTEYGGGSPRLVIEFADGGTIYGYRVQMSTSLSPQSDPLHWDSTSPLLYNAGYDAAVKAHGGSTVVAAYIVTDSGWEGTAYTNTISDITYGDNTYA